MVTVTESNKLEEQDENNLMITTTDNPYNPKEDYGKWRQWDISNGYHTEEYIARMIYIDGADIDVDDDIGIMVATNEAVRSIIEYDVLNVYTLV